MAKIKFGDYLNSKQRREAVYESDDSIARRARALIDADPCAVKAQFRVDNYKKAMELLEQIPGHPDTADMMRECLAGLEAAREDMLISDFEYGKYHLETASAEYEFRKASDELSAVSAEIRGRKAALDADGTEGKTADRQAAAGSDEAEAKALAGLNDRQKPAVSAEQYEKMADEADRLKAEADAQIVRYSKRTTIHRWIALAVVALCAVLALYLWKSGYAWYLAAKLEGMGGIYQSAYSRFYKLGDYLDSREQYQFYKEKYLRQREQEESHALPDADVGDTVEFSGFNWLVLEKDDTKLSLICTAPKTGSAFVNVSYDGEQKPLREEMSIVPESETEISAGEIRKSDDVGMKTSADETGKLDNAEANIPAEDPRKTDDTETGTSAGGSGQAHGTEEQGDDPEAGGISSSASWEKSSLREYLNGAVLEHEFTPAEIAAMEPQAIGATSNEQYGTALSEDAEDRITILSVEQAQSYLEDDVFKKPSVDMWMRTPGHDMESAAYMTSDGNVILYGNDVTDDSLSACPFIVVDYTKLES